VVKLDADSSEALVRSILKTNLQDRLDAEVASGRRVLVDRYRMWADKYAITLRDLDAQRNEAAAHLTRYFKELGYV
jgi:type I restriction enzyme M protein